MMLFSFASTTCSLVAKPTDDTCNVTLPSGTSREKEPSAAVEVPVFVPFRVIVALTIAALSLVELTLPVIVRFCENRAVPNSSEKIHSEILGFNISSSFYFYDRSRLKPQFKSNHQIQEIF